jgi:hypothetical protein
LIRRKEGTDIRRREGIRGKRRQDEKYRIGKAGTQSFQL